MAPPPDILWIVTTQWRAQACGYAGDPNARTPFLDRLAAQSVNFSQAVTPHPFGPFARAALLTGVRSPENGVRDYYDPLPAGSRTVAHALNERGYDTAYFGKWHLARRSRDAELVGEAHARTVVPPEERGGFGHWEGFEGGFLLNDPWLHGTQLPEPRQFSGYQSDVVCERAAEWTGGRATRQRQGGGGQDPGAGRAGPWFCVVSLEAPHPPYDAPAGGVPRRDPAEVVLPRNVPRGGETETRARRELAGYYAHIEATDRAIGNLLSAVDRQAEQAGRPPPLAVFTSVHGDMHGAHGFFRKGWPHEESVRVPLLVRRPPEAAGAARISGAELVSLADLAPWTMSWSGTAANVRSAEPAPGFQRISMPSVVALPRQCDRVWRGVRTHGRKLVLNADGTPWLFFDLAGDPREMKNLATDPARQHEIAALGAMA